MVARTGRKAPNYPAGALPMDFRILTANLYWGRVPPETLVELVRAHDPDAVAVQELRPAAAGALAELLPYGDLTPSDESRGVGIALRAPAEVSRIRLPNRDARVAHLRPEHWPRLARRLDLINVHLTSPTLPPPWLAFRLRAEEARQLDAYLRDTANGHPRLLVGDLNASASWPAYQRIAGHFDDSTELAAERRGEARQATWGPLPNGRRWVVLDHALVAGAGIYDFQTVPIDGSDHHALVVDIVLED